MDPLQLAVELALASVALLLKEIKPHIVDVLIAELPQRNNNLTLEGILGKVGTIIDHKSELTLGVYDFKSELFVPDWLSSGKSLGLSYLLTIHGDFDEGINCVGES